MVARDIFNKELSCCQTAISKMRNDGFDRKIPIPMLILIGCISLLMCSSYLYLPSANGSASVNGTASGNSSTCNAFSQASRESPGLTDSGQTSQGVGASYVVGNTDPPIAIPAGSSGSDSYGTHWYAGSQSHGIGADACVAVTAVSTPSGLPRSGDFYYVLLSVFDNTGSYDQVGFTADHGVWRLTYSTSSSACPPNTKYYTFFPMNLNLSTLYSFGIEVANATLPSSYVLFYAINTGERHILWNVTVPEKGVENLEISRIGHCDSYNYQNYEEVWNTTYKNGKPNFDFNFALNFFCETITCSKPVFPVWKPVYENTTEGSVPAGVKVKITSGPDCSKCVVDISN